VEDLVIVSGVAVQGVPTSAITLADVVVAAGGRLPEGVDGELEVSSL